MMTTPSIDFESPSLGFENPVPTVPIATAQPLPMSTDWSETVRQFQSALARPFAENAALQSELENVVRQLSRSPLAETDACRVTEKSVDVSDMAAAAPVGGPVAPQVSLIADAPMPSSVESAIVPEIPEAIPRQEAASLTVAPQESPIVDAPMPLSVESAIVPEIPEVMPRQEAASLTVAPQESPIVDAPMPSSVESAAVPEIPVVMPRQEVVSTVSAPQEQNSIVVSDGTETFAKILVETAESLPVRPDVVTEVGRSVGRRGAEGSDASELSDVAVAAGVRPEVPVPAVVVPQVAEMSAPLRAVDSVRAAFEPTAVPPTETFLTAANAVADMLLVSPGLLRGEGEIRVQLRPDVLEGSDVRISVTGRQLAVEFVPQTTDVALLIEQNRPQLEQHLAARFQTFQLSVGVRRWRSNDMKGSMV